jgi:hypothetical protein
VRTANDPHARTNDHRANVRVRSLLIDAHEVLSLAPYRIKHELLCLAWIIVCEEELYLRLACSLQYQVDWRSTVSSPPYFVPFKVVL